jgi:hypothetical protein
MAFSCTILLEWSVHSRHTSMCCTNCNLMSIWNIKRTDGYPPAELFTNLRQNASSQDLYIIIVNTYCNDLCLDATWFSDLYSWINAETSYCILCGNGPMIEFRSGALSLQWTQNSKHRRLSTAESLHELVAQASTSMYCTVLNVDVAVW